MHPPTILAIILSSLTLSSTFLVRTEARTSILPLRPGDILSFTDELLSPNGLFKLAFFTPDTNTSFLGISATDPSGDVNVWVANRTVPITDKNAQIAMDVKGVVSIKQVGQFPIELNANSAAVDSIASLDDSGNFVVYELNGNGSTKGVLWQSFDHPTDTLLPRMFLGKNLVTRKTWRLTSWLTDTNPAPGAFSLEWDLTTYELLMKRRGELYWTSGMMEDDNKVFQNFPVLSDDKTSFEYYYQFHDVLNSSQNLFFYTVRGERSSIWKLGPRGNFWDTINLFRLTEDICLGFSSVTPGCHNTQDTPRCRRKGDEYVARTGYFRHVLSHTTDWITNASLSDCWSGCWRNCSCIAYEFINKKNCQYFDANAEFVSDESNGTVYHVLNSTLPMTTEIGWRIWAIIGVVPVILIVLFVFLVYHRRKKIKEEYERNEEILIELTTSDEVNEPNEMIMDEDGKRRRQVKVFSFGSIRAATNEFSDDNKLGQGGFGPVYKGRFPEGQEIAVKRLSTGSGQGLIEFKNEIILIAKLQHMNLVRLLGCCIFKHEKMLIYEYMPNKSLDFFLFDSAKRSVLNWKIRFSIIEGIAQGLLYLHKYSRLRIIHRDLKASNILLDENMVPKISDFGMARIFSREATEALTNRVVGTYGYMAPEYAMDGVFSDKSDVYSFGVLLLEVVSGCKNSSFHHHDRAISLVAYASETWKNRTCLNITDLTLVDASREQIIRCVHIALLCVQDDPADRPSMAEIVAVLSSESIQLPEPNEPAYMSVKNRAFGMQPRMDEREMFSLISITTVPEAR